MITDHPNFEAIRSFKNTILSILTEKQQLYYNQHDKSGYFQGLMIPSQTQLTGELYGPIDFGTHPDDQSESWGSFLPDYFNAETRIPINISVQIYTTPDGAYGWIFRADLWKPEIGPDMYGNDGDHWVWQHNSGAENRQGVWDDWFIEIEGD